jgi:hypothetical protein
MEILNLFPTPVGISYYPDIDKLEEEVDQFINEILSEENKDKPIFDVLTLNGPTISKFYEFMKNAVNEYSKLIEANSRFDVTSSWLLINEIAEAHHHATEPIVACFYVKGKDNPQVLPISGYSSVGDISFVDARGGINLYSRAKPKTAEEQYEKMKQAKTPGKSGGNYFNGSGYFNITPEPGKLVIFPGYLIHFVHQNVSGGDRIVIGSQWDRVFDIEKLDPTKPKTPKATPYWFKSGNLNRYIKLKYNK